MCWVMLLNVVFGRAHSAVFIIANKKEDSSEKL